MWKIDLIHTFDDNLLTQRIQKKGFTIFSHLVPLHY